MADLTLYFGSTPSADHTCAYSAFWNSVSEATRREASTSKIASAMTDAYASETSTDNPYYMANRMYVSIPMAAHSWTTADTFSGAVRVLETNALGNFTIYLIIRVVSDDGATYRGTLYEGEVNSLEWSDAARTNRYWENIPIQNAVSMQENDHLVIEFGTKASNSSSSGYGGRYVFGDDSATDLPLNNTETDVFNPWIAFTYGTSYVLGPNIDTTITMNW